MLKTLRLNSRIVGVALWSISAVVAVDAVYSIWLHPRKASAQPSASYTVTLEQTFMKNGQTRYVNTETYAVRSDGSRMSRFPNSSTSAHAEMFRTLYLATGTMIHIREIAGLITTKSIAPLDQRTPSNNCLSGGETYVGADVISGYRTVKAAQAGRTGWFAIDYGCAMVHDHIAYPDGAVTEKKLVSLVPGEPDPALFYVPASYTAVPLAQWRRPYGAKPGAIQEPHGQEQ